MSYTLNRYYALVPYVGVASVGLSVDASSISSSDNNVNVVCKTISSTSPNENQLWILKNSSGHLKLFTKLASEMYALNVYRGADNMNNCDVFYSSVTNNNNTDSEIELEAVSGYNDVYKIKLTNYSLYLSATSSTSGKNVRWESSTTAARQKWKLISYSIPILKNPISQYTYIKRGFNSSSTPPHYGIDYAAPANTSIKAAAAGTVLFVNLVSGSTVSNPQSLWDFGNALFIQHSDGMAIYMHMISTPNFAVGNTVSVGDVIGYVGSTGDSTGNHLHFEYHTGTMNTASNAIGYYNQGTKVDPQIYM